MATLLAAGSSRKPVEVVAVTSPATHLDPFERDAQCVGQPRLLMPVHTHARVIERGHERRLRGENIKRETVISRVRCGWRTSGRRVMVVSHLQPVPPRGHLRRALVEPVGGERARRTEAADEQNILGARALTSLVPRAVHKLIQPRGGVGGSEVVARSNCNARARCCDVGGVGFIFPQLRYQLGRQSFTL